jgi:hypothetical protein
MPTKSKTEKKYSNASHSKGWNISMSYPTAQWRDIMITKERLMELLDQYGRTSVKLMSNDGHLCNIIGIRKDQSDGDSWYAENEFDELWPLSELSEPETLEMYIAQAIEAWQKEDALVGSRLTYLLHTLPDEVLDSVPRKTWDQWVHDGEDE